MLSRVQFLCILLAASTKLAPVMDRSHQYHNYSDEAATEDQWAEENR